MEISDLIKLEYFLVCCLGFPLALLIGFELGSSVLLSFVSSKAHRALVITTLRSVWNLAEYTTVVIAFGLAIGMNGLEYAEFVPLIRAFLLTLLFLSIRTIYFTFRQAVEKKYYLDLLWTMICFMFCFGIGLIFSNIVEINFIPYAFVLAIAILSFVTLFTISFFLRKSSQDLGFHYLLLSSLKNSSVIFLTSFTLASLYILLLVPVLSSWFARNQVFLFMFLVIPVLNFILLNSALHSTNANLPQLVALVMFLCLFGELVFVTQPFVVSILKQSISKNILISIAFFIVSINFPVLVFKYKHLLMRVSKR